MTPTPTRTPRCAVIGAEHLHVIEIVDGLVRAGAQMVAHTPQGSLVDLYAGWRTDSQPRRAEEILADPTIDVIVTAGIPASRADIARRAIEAGKAVVSAKPGVTTRAQLDELRDALAGRVGRPWTVVFTERIANRAVVRAIEMTRAGVIGEVVRVSGVGPHTLAPEQRPGWFFDPELAGGILVDLASHQVDEFLTITNDAADARITRSSVGNVAHADRPRWHDVATVSLAAGSVEAHHDVDWLSPAGLGTWGDVRLSITGTTGTLEVRANIDVAGEQGAEHLIHVDGEGARRVDVADVRLEWAEVLIDDLADGTENLMSQDHVLRVGELTLQAQEQATRWGSGEPGAGR